jgi:hypothetical protein
MAGNSVSSGYRGAPLPEVPGIIEGWMTVHPGPGGSVSFRVVIGIGGSQAAMGDLLELVVSAENVGGLGHALAGRDRRISSGADAAPSFPCHIGFCRSNAA